MKNQKTRVNKTVRVQRPNAGVVFQMPPVEPKTVGYVVRYENGGVKGGMSEPLYSQAGTDGSGYTANVLTIATGERGTIFHTFELACDAVIASVDFQRAGNLNWNRMYGDYLISPVVAR